MAKEKVSKEDAEEFTSGLGQIVGGSWKIILQAHKLGVPAALGYDSTKMWVQERLGGYARLSMEDSREAARQLITDGLSLRQAGDVLGVSYQTVKNLTDEPKNANENNDDDDGPVKNLTTTQKRSRSRQDLHAEDHERVKSLAPIKGKFHTLVIDPPWDYEWLSIAGRAAPGYATMTEEELQKLDVRAWADERFCHLYLWTTNNFMSMAVDLMRLWGFQHRTVLTWRKMTASKSPKPFFGLGSYFRNSTEHVLFGTSGRDDLCRTRVDNIPTEFEASVGEHSEKPEKFYDIVRRASHPTQDGVYGEAFQRKERHDFKNLYGEKVMLEPDAADEAAE
jgi:N6-adenosine-specific RNA methylase IME4